MSIKPKGVRKLALLGHGAKEPKKYNDTQNAWLAFCITVAAAGGPYLPEKYPGQKVVVGPLSYEEVDEEYDLREPSVILTPRDGPAKTLTLNDGRRYFATYCKLRGFDNPGFDLGSKKIEVEGLTYEEVPAPVVTVGVCWVGGEFIGCREAKEARSRMNIALTTCPGHVEPPIDFEKEKLPIKKRVGPGGGCLLHYYETTTDRLGEVLEQATPADPADTNWTWEGQSGGKKYGKTRADFPTPAGFIRAERNLIAGHESYELLKGKFVTLTPPQGYRYNVTIKIDGAYTAGAPNMTRQQIAEQYLPCGGLEALLMEFKEAEDGSRFEAKIRPEGQKAFRLEATRC